MDARRIPFAPEDEERIASAGLWGMLVGIVSIATALLTSVFAVVQAMKVSNMGSELGALGGGVSSAVIGTTAVMMVIYLAVTVLLAVFLLQASAAFRKVALTDEADQHYLLVGFTKLRNYFLTLGIIIIVLGGGAILLFCSALTCGAMLRH
jgi:hypothetical protein